MANIDVPASSEQVLITAHVSGEGEIQQDGPNSFHQRIDLQTEQIASDAETRNASVGVRLNIYLEEKPGTIFEQMRLFRYGERIRFPAELIIPRNYRNPGEFDYAGYLREKGISFTASAKYNNVELLAGFSGSRLEALRWRVRRSVLRKIHQLWLEQEAGLMDAIVMGEETFIERPARLDFQRSGTYHVLVVSGMNVSILALFTVWFLRKLRLGQEIASLAAIALILAYAAVTNVGPPVWRAGLMFAVYLATRLLYRDRAMLNALGAAALALMIFDPESLFGASFQMTFLCVLLVGGIGVPLIERTIQPYSRALRNLDALAYDRQLPPRAAQFRVDLRLILGRIQLLWPGRIPRIFLLAGLRFGGAFCELVMMSAIMQFGLALPMAYYFHRATSVAMPANLLIIPFLQLLMPAAAIAIAASYVWMALAKFPAFIARFALRAITGTVGWLGGIRLADIRVPMPALGATLFAACAVAACMLLVRRRVAVAFCGIALMAASAAGLWLIPAREQVRRGIFEFTSIDVGQGDSLLLVVPSGQKILIDGGGLPFWTHSQLDIGEDVVSPYLWTRGISKIDAVALTHAHADHMGGLSAVIANFHPHELWLPVGVRNGEIHALLHQARQAGVNVVYQKAGDSFSYGGAEFRVLAPAPEPGDFAPRDDRRRNDESLVMKVSYGGTSALLEGDAERATERLVASEDPHADVLKVAHHGSASSTNEYLLDAVHPKFAVISVGARNVYRHPRPEVLKRLQEAEVATFRTDLNGATSFFLDGKSVTTKLAVLP